jgi:hypothetical protein
MERQWETAFVTPVHFTVENEASVLALSKELNDSLLNSSQKSSVLQQVMSTLRYSRLTQAEMDNIVPPEVSLSERLRQCCPFQGAERQPAEQQPKIQCSSASHEHSEVQQTHAGRDGQYRPSRGKFK